jgi:condensin complex subunit 1
MSRPKAVAATDPDAMDEDQLVGDKSVDKTEDGDVTMTQDGSVRDEKEKDVGDAFELSQLLFVVGHIAIKYIVFLELVEREREWKRQKDEKTAGTYFLFFVFLLVC